MSERSTPARTRSATRRAVRARPRSERSRSREQPAPDGTRDAALRGLRGAAPCAREPPDRGARARVASPEQRERGRDGFRPTVRETSWQHLGSDSPLFQDFRELPPRAEEEHLDARPRETERLRDLAMVRAFHISQPEEGAVARLERGERAVELVPSHRGKLGVRSVRSISDLGDRRNDNAASRLSPPVGGEIRADPVEVSLPLTAHGRQAGAAEPEIRLLEEVVGERAVAAEPREIRPERTGRLPVERFEL